MIHLHIHKTDSHSMKNALLCFTMMLLSLLPASGRNNEYTVRYALRLASVACDKDCGFVQPITEDSFADLDGLPTTTYRYKDDVVSMSWYVSDEAFNFTMINKSDSTMKLWWKDMSTRDINGVPSYISYTMEKPRFYIALDVPSHTGLNGYLIPLRNYPSNPKKDIRPLIEGTYLSQRAAKRAAEKIVGKDYHLYFPIHIGDEVYGYNLTFTVDKALGLLKQTKGQEEDYEVTTWDKVTESKGINFLVKGRRGKKNSESSPSLSQEEDWAKAEGDHKEEKAETAKHTVPSFDTPPLPTYAQLLETIPEPRDTTSALYRLIQYAARTDFFSQACPQEKVYLHLDNTAYFQGETIWFAANVVGPEANGYVAPSKVLYVELLSPTGVVLQQQKLKVEEGRCHGAFPLVDTAVKEAVALRGAIGYPSGYYQIRAYTRAMLNFDEASIYSRVIPVYKAPDEEGQYANPVLRKYNGKETYRPTIEKPTEKTDKRSKLRTQRRSNGRVKDDPNDELQMTFYPEGGHLIRGVTCRIAFKATDRHGHGVTIDRLFNPEGQPLKLTLGRHGMGSFTLYNSDSEPITYVTAIYNGSAHEFSLPQSEDAGCALRMGDLERGLLPFTVSARHMTADTVLAYAVSHGGHVYAFDTLHLATPPDREVTLPTPGSGSNLRSTNNTKEKIFEPRIASERLLLSANRLPTGVCQFTLYGATGNIYAQRLFFVDNGVQTVPVTVTADKETYRPFDPIMLRLQAADTVPTTFSLAVRDDADYGTANHDNILTYLLLSSELKGLIEEPDWYFRNGELGMENGDFAAQSDALSTVKNSQFSTLNSQFSTPHAPINNHPSAASAALRASTRRPALPTASFRPSLQSSGRQQCYTLCWQQHHRYAPLGRSLQRAPRPVPHLQPWRLRRHHSRHPRPYRHPRLGPALQALPHDRHQRLLRHYLPSAHRTQRRPHPLPRAAAVPPHTALPPEHPPQHRRPPHHRGHTRDQRNTLPHSRQHECHLCRPLALSRQPPLQPPPLLRRPSPHRRRLPALV